MISDYGVTAGLALVLVWWLISKQDEALGRVETALAAHAQVTSTTSAAFVTFATEQRAQTSALIALLRQTCINTSQTDLQRRECIR